jgi:hypothetical protein
MKTTWLRLGILAAAIGVSATAQTYTNIMSGEDSTQLTFPSSPASGQHATVTSVQSPFSFPSSNTSQNDYYYTFPTGNSGLTPPWWFSYQDCSPGPICADDSTGGNISRPPTNGQISSLKSSGIGLLAQATFKGTVSYSALTSPADLYETFYFTERDDYAGQREIGFVRDQGINTYYQSSYDITYAYWYTNDNCGVGGGSGPNMGEPWCRTSQATGAAEDPGTAWNDGDLAATGINYVLITGLTIGTEYIYQAYIFWASWDSTYKLRVEVWDSTFTTQIFASNLDTTNGTDNLNLTTSGTNGYVTLGTVRADPYDKMGGTGVELDVTSYVQIITP